jgi:DNA-binding response OmpR family regulator
MTPSPAPTLTIVSDEDRPSALVIEVPAGTPPALWQLVERVGVALEGLFAAVSDQNEQVALADHPATSEPPTRLPVGGSDEQHQPGEISLDLQARTVSRNGEDLQLTHLEFELLAYFANNPSRAINRDELLDHVWREPAHFYSRTVDVHIRRLRVKLGPALRVTTVRGFGYRFDGWSSSQG